MTGASDAVNALMRFYAAEEDAGDDTVFTRARVVATLRATGKTMEFPILHPVTIKDGKFFLAEPFDWDIAALLEVLSNR